MFYKIFKPWHRAFDLPENGFIILIKKYNYFAAV